MSRTYKDRPSRVKYEPWDKDRIFSVTGVFNWIFLPTTKTKKRKEVDTEEHWMGTPSNWTRLMMNRPLRAKWRNWEAKVKGQNVDETLDYPGVGKKPHIYYW